MPISSTSDIDFALKDAPDSVAIAYGSAPVQNTYGLLDRDTIQADGGESAFEFKGPATTVVIRDGSLAGLKEDQQITVGGVVYRIRDIGSLETDGTRRLQLVS